MQPPVPDPNSAQHTGGKKRENRGKQGRVERGAARFLGPLLGSRTLFEGAVKTVRFFFVRVGLVGLRWETDSGPI